VANGTRPVVLVEGLEKRYGDLRAVDGLSFGINEGEVFSLLGPNGAGKTTTVEILEGIRRGDGGKVEVMGLDPWSQGYELHKRVGVIPQGFTFFRKATPREAITYYAALFGRKVDPDEILREVLLDDSPKTLFENLSGGQKQKTGLALALVNSPEVLFLDEPTTGLDPAARRAVWDVIHKLKASGKTILLTTHYLDEAQQLSDRVAIINKGRIIAIGTPDEIIAEHGSGERLEILGDPTIGDYLRENTKLKVENHNGSMVSVAIERRRDALEALQQVEQSGLRWTGIRTREDSLEDVFIKLVGHAAGPNGAAGHKGGGSK